MIISILVVGIIGLLIGILLSLASIKFEVKVDENEEKIRAILPGNNCGACGLLVPLLKKKHPSINVLLGAKKLLKK